MVDEWMPVGPTEEALLTAAMAGDGAAFGTELAGSNLLLPVTEAAAEGLESPRWATNDLEGVTFLLAFTSPEALAAIAAPGSSVRYRVTDFFDLVEHWPDPEWRMALNPGLPIGAQLTSAELRDLVAAGPPIPLKPDRLTEAEETLWATLRAGDSPDFMATLIRQPLLLPLAPSGGLSRDMTDSEFPWWCVDNELGEPGLPIFTSEHLLESVLGDREFIEVSFPQLAESWPDSAWYLMVNPNTSLTTRLTGTQVQGLGTWFGDLRDAFHEDVAEYNQRVAEEQLLELAGQDLNDLSAPLPAALSAVDGAVSDSELGPDSEVPLVLQLVIPHAYLSSYLERGYDRAAGLIHTWYGVGRETPIGLYRRLGLLGSGSPFTTADEWVAVLRWLPDAATPPEWGRGEPRMEALVIPDGAEIHRIHADRTEDLLARFDAGARRWLPIGEVTHLR